MDIDISQRELFSALLWPSSRLRQPRFERFVPKGSSFLAALSVRSVFDALLAALALPRGTEIVVTAVNIESMSEIARAHGLRLRPVDLELSDLLPRLENVEAALEGGAKMFLLAHLYGTRGKVDQFAALCQKKNVLFVEDCAQAFDGQLTASSADVTLYSFGTIKTSTALGGAIALFQSSILAEKVASILGTYPELSDSWFRRRLFKYLFIKAMLRPRAFGLAMQCIKALGGDPQEAVRSMTKGFPGSDLLMQIRRRAPVRQLMLLESRLRQATTNPERRRRALSIISSISDMRHSPGADSPSHSWWLTPILSVDPDNLMRALTTKGFQATRGATSLHVIAAPGIQTPNAKYLLDNVLYLPNSKYISRRQVDAMVDIARKMSVRAVPAEVTCACR